MARKAVKTDRCYLFRHFHAPQAPDIAALRSELETRLKAQFCVHRSSLPVSLLDTPNLALSRAGLSLLAYPHPQGWRYRLIDDHWQLLGEQASQQPISLAAELEQLPARFHQLTELQSLLPWREAIQECHRFRLYNRKGEVVGNGWLCHWPLSHGAPLLLEIHCPIQAQKACDKRLQRLPKHWHLPEVHLSTLSGLGEQAQQRQPAIPQPPPTLPARCALTVLLHHQFEQLQREQLDLLANYDSECLHRYRVSLRRLRALWQASKALRQPEASALHTQELQRLGQLSTPARDWQVLELALQRWSEQDKKLRRDLRDLLPLVQERTLGHLHRLQQYVDSHEHLQWQHQFIEQLEKGALWRSETPGIALGALAAGQLKQTLQRLTRPISRSHPVVDDSALHRLRLQGKRLRYLLEFYSHLLPKPIEATLHRLKQLQDALGEFQDQCVQQQLLNELTVHLTRAGTPELPSRSLATLARLQQGLQEQQAQARQHAHKRLHRLRQNQHQQAIRQLERRFTPWLPGAV